MKQSCEFNPSPNLSIIQKQNEVKFVALQFMNKLPCPIIYIPQKQLQKITHYRAYYKNNHISSNKCLSTYLKFSLKLWRGILVEARWFSFQRTVILSWLILITKKKNYIIHINIKAIFKCLSFVKTVTLLVVKHSILILIISSSSRLICRSLHPSNLYPYYFRKVMER